MELTGIHHLTAVSADIRENHRFYTGTLGMRLVKRSVNQDDVSAYHLFYADAVRIPGTDLTFFDWPVPRERRGTRSIVRTALRVTGRDTLEWWAARFRLDGRRSGRDRRARRPADARLRGPRGPAARAGRRRRRGRRAHAVGAEPGAGRAPDPRPRPDRDERADVSADRRGADRGDEHAPGARVPASATTPRTRCTSSRWARAARTPSCTSPCSRTCRLRGRARAACTTSRSARRPRRSTTPGRSGWTRWACRTAARSTGSGSAASTSASRTASCSRSPPTGRASRSTRIRRRSARRWCCRRSSSRAGIDPGRTGADRLESASWPGHPSTRAPSAPHVLLPVRVERRRPVHTGVARRTSSSSGCPGSGRGFVLERDRGDVRDVAASSILGPGAHSPESRSRARAPGTRRHAGIVFEPPEHLDQGTGHDAPTYGSGDWTTIRR